MTLKELQAGESAVIEKVGGAGALRQHFLDMGLIPGAEVTVVKFAPLGDPVELKIHGYELTLRLDDAAQIEVVMEEPGSARAASVGQGKEAAPGMRAGHAARLDKSMESHGVGTAPGNSGGSLVLKSPQEAGAGRAGRTRGHKSPHPALGEENAAGLRGGRSHGTPAFPEDHVYRFALVGNQNSGKTTLFNRLTGANQHVGNFPGVTVDRKDGVIIGHRNTLITDLTGIYSMSPYSSEELVSRNFVLDEKPDAIINIVDATNIDRNLYLTMQLLEMERPVVVALNMMDELTGNHGSVDINLMEKLLGVPVVPISAARNQGVDELIKHALSVAKYQTVPEKQDFCPEEDHGGALHRCIHSVSYLIEDHAARAGLSPAAAGSMLVFSLLYTPCVAAIASIRRELGGRWAAGVVFWQCVVAWIAAFGFHAIAGLFG